MKMRRCEDEKVRRWEGEIQTPTIGRTLRSDALGKNGGRQSRLAINAVSKKQTCRRTKT